MLKKTFYLCMAVMFIAAVLAMKAAGAQARYVIEISVDGLGSSYLATLIGRGQVPNISRIKNEGVSTLNARDDYDMTVTLPNHTTMITGRGVMGAAGHNWTRNSDPAPGKTIHSNKGSYVASVFDVAHDNGLRTAMYATKSKFSLFDVSYDATNGAADTTGADNGRKKIDTYIYSGSSASITNSFVTAMKANPFNYSFIHYGGTDIAGHINGWGSNGYNNAIKAVDGYLGQILYMIDRSATLGGRTTIILTSDHGGHGIDHSNASDPCDYTIPFIVWGAGAAAGQDFYAINTGIRLDPGTGRPTYQANPQPVRNGDGANLALKLLGLGAIGGSTINNLQDLKLCSPNIAGDLEPDCKVNFYDLRIMASQWLHSPGIPSADIAPAPTGDNAVNFLDFTELAGHWL